MSAVIDVLGAHSASVIGIPGGIDAADTAEDLLYVRNKHTTIYYYHVWC